MASIRPSKQIFRVLPKRFTLLHLRYFTNSKKSLFFLETAKGGKNIISFYFLDIEMTEIACLSNKLSVRKEARTNLTKLEFESDQVKSQFR